MKNNKTLKQLVKSGNLIIEQEIPTFKLEFSSDGEEFEVILDNITEEDFKLFYTFIQFFAEGDETVPSVPIKTLGEAFKFIIDKKNEQKNK